MAFGSSALHHAGPCCSDHGRDLDHAAHHAHRSRALGLPIWTGNGPTGFPPAPYKFLAQFDTHLRFDGPLPSADDAGTDVSIYTERNRDNDDYREVTVKKPNALSQLRKERGRSYYYSEWANLGSDGTGYLFINRAKATPRVVWFWNR